ncbi:hypothetical protein AB0G02_29030, partial [Actinosynnema sp. NPDC023658]
PVAWCLRTLVVRPVRWVWRNAVVPVVRAVGVALWWLVRLFGAALVWAFRLVGRGLAVLGRAVRDAAAWAWRRVVGPVWRVVAPVGRFVGRVWRAAVVAPARWARTSVLDPVRSAGRRLRGAFGARRG